MSTQPPTTPDQEDPHVAQLIREAKAAIKMGDKASAREKLQEAVALDQYSEQGWYWLAAVVTTDEERKTCLGNVVVINPNNKRALDMLDKLNGNLNAGLLQHEDARLTGDAIIETPAKRQPIVLAVVGIAIVALVGVFLISRSATPPPLPTSVSTQSVAVASTNSQAAVATNAATSDATATKALVVIPATLPPTWTPQPSATAAGSVGTPMATPPPGLTGRLVAVSGSLLTGKGNLPVYTIDPNNPKLNQVTSEIGDYAILTPDGLRLIYSRFIASTDSFQLRLMNSNGSQAGELSRLWGNVPPLADTKEPSISRNGLLLVFSANSLTQNDSTPDIYSVSTASLVTLTSGSEGGAAVESTIAPDAAGTITTNDVAATPVQRPTATGGPVAQVMRITPKESGVNTWPAVSPDGSKIVYINDAHSLGKDAIDIFVVSAAGGEAQNLTRDNMVLIEGAPEFSPDGSKIAYHGAAEGSKANNVFVMDADGTNKLQLTDGLGDNIRPHWSLDGKYIAFSSTRNGKWEIYVIALDTKTIYQVTQTQASTIATGWGPN